VLEEAPERAEELEPGEVIGGEEDEWGDLEGIESENESVQPEEGDEWGDLEEIEEEQAEVRPTEVAKSERVQEMSSVGRGAADALEKVEELLKMGKKTEAQEHISQLKKEIQQNRDAIAKDAQIDDVQNAIDAQAEQFPESHKILSDALAGAREGVHKSYYDGHENVVDEVGNLVTMIGVDNPEKRDRYVQEWLASLPKKDREIAERVIRDGGIRWLTVAEAQAIRAAALAELPKIFEALNRELDLMLEKLRAEKDKKEVEKEAVVDSERARLIEKEEVKQGIKKKEQKQEELKKEASSRKSVLETTEEAVSREQRTKDVEFAREQKEDLLRTKTEGERQRKESVREEEGVKGPQKQKLGRRRPERREKA